jgi:hypothetical protein
MLHEGYSTFEAEYHYFGYSVVPPAGITAEVPFGTSLFYCIVYLGLSSDKRARAERTGQTDDSIHVQIDDRKFKSESAHCNMKEENI